MSITTPEANIKLSEAIRHENLEEVERWFQQAEVYTTSRGLRGLSPYHRLYSCSSLEIMKFALDKGVDPNYPLMDIEGQTLIYGAIRNVQPKLVKLLAQHGAQINRIDANGDTPLSFAVQNEDRMKLVPLLIELGAKPSLGNNVFSILKGNSQRLSQLHKYLEDSFETMIAEDQFKILKIQMKEWKQMDEVPQNFLDDFDMFEDLADLNLQNEAENEERRLTEINHARTITREESSQDPFTKHSDGETADTWGSHLSLSRTDSDESHCHHEGGRYVKYEDKAESQNKNEHEKLRSC